jgi:hypothetical protein
LKQFCQTILDNYFKQIMIHFQERIWNKTKLYTNTLG